MDTVKLRGMVIDMNDEQLHTLKQIRAFRIEANPYVNFHRLTLFVETTTDANGRCRKRYPDKLSMTSYDKHKLLP